jgi:hypothetical protein
MTVHNHNLVLDGSWFTCEGCTACVEVVPRFESSPEGVKVTVSVRVRNTGWGGFNHNEMGRLARFWLGHFRIYMEQREKLKLPGWGSRRQLVSMSNVQVVGVGADVSGVDRSAA